MFHLALNLGFHDFWQSLSVGLSVLILISECLGLSSNQPVYLTHANHWSRLLVIALAAQTVSGIPLIHGLTSPCDACASLAGDIDAPSPLAAVLVLGLAGVMLWGWGRMAKGSHLILTALVAAGATLAAFWMMAMGVTVRTSGASHQLTWQLIAQDVTAIFNPGMERSIPYLWLGSITTGIVVVGGVSAWKLFRREQPAFFARSFKVTAWLLLVVASAHVMVLEPGGMAIFSTEALRITNGVNAWLLLLAAWTVSSWRHVLRRTDRTGSEGRLLLAWIFSLPLPLVGNASLLITRLTESTSGQYTNVVVNAGVSAWFGALLQVTLAVLFLLLASRWFAQRVIETALPGHGSAPSPVAISSSHD